MKQRGNTKRVGNALLESALTTQIVEILLRQKPAKKILLFGSRARGDAKPTSDIDLAIFDKDWTDTDVNLAKNALEEELKTPLKFDLVHFEGITKAGFKDLILKEGMVLYESRQGSSAV